MLGFSPLCAMLTNKLLHPAKTHGIITLVRVKPPVHHAFSMHQTSRGVKNLANIKSAKKRVGITAKQNLRNRMIRSAMKTSIKRYDQALTEGDTQAAEAAYIKAVSTVDKAASKGVIHKNAASRKKAQLAVKRTAAAN